MKFGFFVCDNKGNVWKNGRQLSMQKFGKLLTPEQMEKFEQIKEKYFESLDKS